MHSSHLNVIDEILQPRFVRHEELVGQRRELVSVPAHRLLAEAPLQVERQEVSVAGIQGLRTVNSLANFGAKSVNRMVTVHQRISQRYLRGEKEKGQGSRIYTNAISI